MKEDEIDLSILAQEPEIDLSILQEPEIDLSILAKEPEIDLSILAQEPKEDIDLSILTQKEEDKMPSLGSIGTGIGAELLVGEGAKYALTTYGAGIAGPAGAFIGYGIGAVTGGITGSLAAQRIEGRDKVSWGRVAADTILNIIPFGVGKAPKAVKAGEKVFPELAKKVGKRAATGAAISTGAVQVEKGIEEGRLLTPQELILTAGTGGALNIGIGALSDSLSSIYARKFAGKNSDEVNKAYEKGDPETSTFIDTTTGGDKKNDFFRFMDVISSYVMPSGVIGRKGSKEVRKFMQEAEAAQSFAGRARKQIQNLTSNFSEEQKVKLNDYMAGRIKELPPEMKPAQDIIDQVREEIGKYQQTLTKLYEDGVLKLEESTYKKILKSMEDGDYLRTEYKLYVDPKYVPSETLKKKLKDKLVLESQQKAVIELKEQGKSKQEIDEALDSLLEEHNEQAERYIRELLDARGNPDSLRNVLKRKEEQYDEMKDFLGIITDPGERLFGTLARIGRDASVLLGQAEVSKFVVRTGIGKLISQGEIPIDYVPLKIGGRIQDTFGRERITKTLAKPVFRDLRTGEEYSSIAKANEAGVPTGRLEKITQKDEFVGGEVVYVPKEYERAMNILSSREISAQSSIWAARYAEMLFGKTTALSKFAKVPLSLAAYPVQIFGNMMMVSALGINPISAFLRMNPDKRSVLNPLGIEGFGRGIKIALSDVNSLGLREGKFGYTIQETKRLKELGILEQDIIIREIEEGLRDGFLGKILPTRTIGKIYSVFDAAQRVAVYDHYKNFILKGLSPADRAKLPTEKLEELAAEMTNATYQNYSRISPTLRYLSRIGVLNEFASFNLEQLRTTFNSGVLLRDMISGKFVDDIAEEYGVSLDRQYVKNDGLRRLAMMSTMIGGVTVGLNQFNRQKGISEEEEEALRETVVPDWDRNSKLLFNRDGDNIKIANASYQFPMAELTSVLESGLRGEDGVDAVGKTFTSAFDKLGGAGTMNMTNFYSALVNRDPRTGRPISSEPEGVRQFKDRFLYYSAETFNPTLLGKTSDKTIPDLIWRYTLGLRNQNTTIMDGAGFKFRALKDNINNIRRSYSSDFYQDKDMVSSYQERNATYQRNLAQVIRHVRNLRILGKSDEEINKAMSKNGLSKSIRESALNGEMDNMPLAVGISGSRAERKEKLLQIYDKLPPEIGVLMLNEAKGDGKIKQSTVNEVIRQSQLNKLNPDLSALQ